MLGVWFFPRSSWLIRSLDEGRNCFVRCSGPVRGNWASMANGSWWARRLTLKAHDTSPKQLAQACSSSLPNCKALATTNRVINKSFGWSLIRKLQVGKYQPYRYGNDHEKNGHHGKLSDCMIDYIFLKLTTLLVCLIGLEKISGDFIVPHHRLT